MSGSTPLRFAFFDVDETLVQEKTMFTVLAELDRELGQPDADQVVASLRAMRQEGLDRRTVNQAFYEALRGLRRSDVRAIARSYVERRLRDGVDRPFLIEPAVAHLKALAQAGIHPVFVSGSAIDFLEALAEHLGAYAVLATDLELAENGDYTGRIRGRSMIGAGKRTAVEQFLSDQGAYAGDCHGLGDHISDFEFLELLGHPGILPGDAELEDIADRRGWFVLRAPASSPTNPFAKVSLDA